MESYLKNKSSIALKFNIDEAKENKDKTSLKPILNHFPKNSSENFFALAKEKLFDPKDYLLKERLNQFNNNNLNKIQNLNSDNSNALEKSINDRKSIILLFIIDKRIFHNFS